jgi:protein-S-isoprenylcysteine O-methyltransferase Ste14
MSGLSFSRRQPLRTLVSLALLAAGVAWVGLSDVISARFAITCFVLSLALRHGFLFASLARAGFAPWLKARFDAERAVEVHESVLSALVFAQRLSFAGLLYATARAASGPFGLALLSLGSLLLVVGVVVSVWATKVVGLDTYHYRDLFMGPRYMSVELRGPYAFLRNPTYGVGQLAAYGAALLALSPIGLVAAALNQVTLYIFNDLIEQPRLRLAKGVFMESQLRYALARTLQDDPRSERHRRRSSRPPARVRRSGQGE